MRSVTLVCGPPAAGKTTWVRAHAKPGAAILDWDSFARAAGSTARWNHPKAVTVEAEDRMQAAMGRVANADEGVHYVIRCAPSRSRRESMAGYLRADRVIVLLPPLGVLMARVEQRSNVFKAQRGIRDWLRDYSPSPLDELITAAPTLRPRHSEAWD